MTLLGSVAVVTGGTRGIGRAVAEALGRAGARVAVCGRGAARVDGTVSALREAGLDAAGFPCDVTDPDQVRRFGEQVRETLGEPHVLVNNAGIGRFAPLDEMSLEDWDAVIATNLRSLYLVTRAFLPAMKRRGSGTIVNVASLAGRNGFAGGTAYAASKHAALGFSKSLMLEVRQAGVRVVAVCPGSVDTAFFDDAPMEPARERILKPEDVADTIVHALTLPDRAMVSELDIRPANP